MKCRDTALSRFSKDLTAEDHRKFRNSQVYKSIEPLPPTQTPSERGSTRLTPGACYVSMECLVPLSGLSRQLKTQWSHAVDKPLPVPFSEDC